MTRPRLLLAPPLLQAIEMVTMPAGLMMPISWGSLPFDVAYFVAGLAGI